MTFDLKLSTLPKQYRDMILKTLIVKPSPTQYEPSPTPYDCYVVNREKDTISLPLGVWQQYLNKFPNTTNYDKMNKNVQFIKKLLTIDTDPDKRGRDQDVIVKTALNRLDKYGSVFLSIHTGGGKCLGYGTEVLMYDGTKKEVQNIKTDDLIMGDDSTPRTILSTCQGEEELYEIVPTKGESFIMNESHILTLKFSGQGSICYNKKFNRYRVTYFDGKNAKTLGFDTRKKAEVLSSKVSNTIFDIPLRDYIKFSKSIKLKLKSFWVPILYPYQNVPIDPYFLGLWLGDGTKRNAAITTIDVEIVEYLEQFAKDSNLLLSRSKQVNRTYSYNLRGKSGGGLYHTNFILTEMNKLNLRSNKHIPLIYKANSCEIRLKVLAGLIDTDGYYSKGGGYYEIVQKLEILAHDIQDLCRSLGYACFLKPCKKGCMYKGVYREGTYYRVRFYGENLQEIPVLLQRKKASPRLQIKNPLVTGFKVVPKGIGKYYGFCIDGNHRFVLGSYMVTHNTAQSIYLSITLGLKTVILSHLDVVKQQWAEEYENFAPGIKTQFLNKPNSKLDPDVDVYIIGIQKAFISNFDFSKIGTVIVDEAHIATVTAFTQTLFKFRPRYLIGLSATPNRSDGLDILFNLYFGAKEEFIIRKEKKDFIVYKVETEFEPSIEYKNVKGRQTVNWNTVVQSIEENPDRWRLIVDIVLNHPRHKIIILCNRKILSNGIYNLLIEKGEDAELLIESKKKWNKDARVLVAGFKKGGVGLNDPKLTMAIIASDTKDSRQYEGRIRTVNNIIYHIVDCYNPLQNHYKACEKFYIEKGATIEKITKYNIMIQKYYYNYLLLKYMDIDVIDIKDEILTFFICSLID